MKQFAQNAKQGRHCIFIFGHSLAENDDHILTRIGRGRCPKLYVGLYGDPDSPANKVIVDRARALAGVRREERYPLEVAFYDAGSARVWGA